jgi:hypothetical protein
MSDWHCMPFSSLEQQNHFVQHKVNVANTFTRRDYVRVFALTVSLALSALSDSHNLIPFKILNFVHKKGCEKRIAIHESSTGPPTTPAICNKNIHN